MKNNSMQTEVTITDTRSKCASPVREDVVGTSKGRTKKETRNLKTNTRPFTKYENKIKTKLSHRK